jgi:hypothetical protein
MPGEYGVSFSDRHLQSALYQRNNKKRHDKRGVFIRRKPERIAYTTAPSVSSRSLTGLIRSSRLTPSHMAIAAATNTDE